VSSISSCKNLAFADACRRHFVLLPLSLRKWARCDIRECVYACEIWIYSENWSNNNMDHSWEITIETKETRFLYYLFF
jgi:hypothetical protein